MWLHTVVPYWRTRVIEGLFGSRRHWNCLNTTREERTTLNFGSTGHCFVFSLRHSESELPNLALWRCSTIKPSIGRMRLNDPILVNKFFPKYAHRARCAAHWMHWECAESGMNQSGLTCSGSSHAAAFQNIAARLRTFSRRPNCPCNTKRVHCDVGRASLAVATVCAERSCDALSIRGARQHKTHVSARRTRCRLVDLEAESERRLEQDIALPRRCDVPCVQSRFVIINGRVVQVLWNDQSTASAVHVSSYVDVEHCERVRIERRPHEWLVVRQGLVSKIVLSSITRISVRFGTARFGWERSWTQIPTPS